MILHSPSISSKITHFSPTRFSYKPLCRDIKPGTAPHGTSKLARRKSLFILLSATREKAGDCVCMVCRRGLVSLDFHEHAHHIVFMLFDFVELWKSGQKIQRKIAFIFRAVKICRRMFYFNKLLKSGMILLVKNDRCL